MAEKPKGNLVYEILIVVLILALVGTILYPARIWRGEDEQQNICRTRMETVYLISQLYKQQYGEYVEISSMKESVAAEPANRTLLDSLIYWDGLDSRDRLKTITGNLNLPEDLRTLIQTKLANKEPLGNLMYWDRLDEKLIQNLNEKINVDSLDMAALDTSIRWEHFFSAEEYGFVLNDPSIPAATRTAIRSALRQDQNIQNSRYWKFLQPIFYDTLRSLTNKALETDIWPEEKKDEWELIGKKNWEATMDQYSQADQDSIWKEMERSVWDSEKELIWKKDRKRLWNAENETWRKDNDIVISRVLSSLWSRDKKAEWSEKTLKSLPDSMKQDFQVKADSIWRSLEDSLKVLELPKWMGRNKGVVEETVHNLWESDRRFSWEPDARVVWQEDKISDRTKLWKQLKETIWNTEKSRLWTNEERKEGAKISAKRRLDKVVSWIDVMGREATESMVADLKVPDYKKLWKEIRKNEEIRLRKNKKNSVLYTLGLVDLMRGELMESLTICPTAKEPYLMTTISVEVGSFMEIKCPIIDTTSVITAARIDTAAKDTTFVPIKISILKKLLGGASIKSHGGIDESGKKSWEKKSG